MSKSNSEASGFKLPVVTVIIPSYNYGHFVGHAIESVGRQDYEKLQLVVIDDGSTDDTFESLKHTILIAQEGQLVTGTQFAAGTRKFDAIERPIVVFRHPNAFGPSAARNTGIKATADRTTFFVFLDADDYWLPGKVSKSVAKFMLAPDKLGLVYTDNVSLNMKNLNKIREYREPYDRPRLLQHNMIHSGSMVSKAVLEKVGLFDEKLRVAEDLDLWIRISEQFMVHHIPEALVVQRVHDQNSTNTVDMKIWQAAWEYIAQKTHQRHASKQLS